MRGANFLLIQHSKFLKRAVTTAVLLLLVAMLYWMGRWFILVGIVIVAFLCIAEWLSMVKQRWPREKLLGLSGFFYILTACSFGGYLLFDQSLEFNLWFSSAVWAMDSAAYFTGKTIGGAKMVPFLSPRKTWAGFIGGTIAVFLVTALFDVAGWLEEVHNPLLFALPLAILAQAGDLLISAAKRRYQVKDSSNILPGHGGMLDRVDALLAVWLVIGLIYL